jgi:hypothetical protein
MIPHRRKKKYTNLLLCGFLRVLWCVGDEGVGWMIPPLTVVRRVLVGMEMVYG